MRALFPALITLIAATTPIVTASEPPKTNVTAEKNNARKALEAFAKQRKFLPEGLYSGVFDETERLHYEARINALADRLRPLTDQPSPKVALLKELEAAFPDFELADTEDRERALAYFEELMAIFGVASSDGLLNKLAYGFDPAKSLEANNQEAQASMTPAEREWVKTLEQLTEETALPYLTKALGPPSTNNGSTYMWMRESEPDKALSLGLEPGKAFILWLAHGHMMYSKRF